MELSPNVRRTLSLYAPSDAFAVLPLKVLALDVSVLCETLDICENLPFKCIGYDVVRYARVDGDGHESIQRRPSHDRQAGHYSLSCYSCVHAVSLWKGGSERDGQAPTPLNCKGIRSQIGGRAVAH